MAAEDLGKFGGPRGLGPGRFHFAITPSDTAELPHVTRSVYVGVGGNLCLILAGNNTALVYQNVPAGSWLPLQVRQVKATDTTATGLIGVY